MHFRILLIPEKCILLLHTSSTFNKISLPKACKAILCVSCNVLSTCKTIWLDKPSNTINIWFLLQACGNYIMDRLYQTFDWIVFPSEELNCQFRSNIYSSTSCTPGGGKYCNFPPHLFSELAQQLLILNSVHPWIRQNIILRGFAQKIDNRYMAMGCGVLFCVVNYCIVYSIHKVYITSFLTWLNHCSWNHSGARGGWHGIGSISWASGFLNLFQTHNELKFG